MRSWTDCPRRRNSLSSSVFWKGSVRPRPPRSWAGRAARSSAGAPSTAPRPQDNAAREAQAAPLPPNSPPNRQRSPDFEGHIDTITLGTAEEKQNGIRAHIILKKVKATFQITTKTEMQFSKG